MSIIASTESALNDASWEEPTSELRYIDTHPSTSVFLQQKFITRPSGKIVWKRVRLDIVHQADYDYAKVR